MKQLKVYIAGKVSKESVFGTHDWRDGLCAELERLSGVKIKNIDPTKAVDGFENDQSNAELVYGRDCYMISQADVVIVNLTDDISVGGSQEMLLARHFEKPLIGIAPWGGKFRRPSKELMGRVYKDWVDPFVSYSCDALVGDLKELAQLIEQGIPKPKHTSVGSMVDRALHVYLNEYHASDTYLH